MRQSQIVQRSILGLLVLITGCSAGGNSVEEELKNFGVMYYNTQEVLQSPPTQWEQVLRLVDVPELKEDYTRLEQFKNADYVIVWGVDAKSAVAGQTVLSYPKSALQEGGPVLFADGSVIQMSADELTAE